MVKIYEAVAAVHWCYLCVTSPSAEMVRLGVQIKVQVKANFFLQKYLYGPTQGVYQVWSL